MFIIMAVLAGLLVGIIDAFLIKRGNGIIKSVFMVIGDAVGSNLISLFVTDIIYKYFDRLGLFPLRIHSPKLPFIYFAITFAIGMVWVFVMGLIDKKLIYKAPEKKQKKILSVISVVSVILMTLGMAALTGTVWGKETFSDVAPDQMIVNMFSPTDGTSSEVMDTLWQGPVLQTAAVAFFFALFTFSTRVLYLKRKEKEVCLFPNALRKIISLVLALVIFVGGVAYGIEQFQLVTLYNMYYKESDFIKDNFADPREVKMQFPEKKRNLIHIYLESMENTYLSKDLGGYMDENLLAPLTELAEEGVSFSHTDKGFGGPISTMGCTWSVAAMVNMTTGLPMKVPTEHNAYGSKDNFLPGAVTIGDILKAQGYEQSLMFGATAKFGGLNFFYESHGDFNILDYDAAKEKGWIPEDYNVWWGYEDDKLYEYAKTELTRLHETGKPFHFVMETADTHFPDGYVGPNTPTPRDSQYANVIAYSASEVTKFVRWIQKQPFYENTTIVLIGDHLSMDRKFFKDFDTSYRRTTFNLILNPAGDLADIPEERTQNRWWYNGDMFPTMLASIGVKIDGEKLGLGTNLFSGEPTLFEMNGEGEDGWKVVDGNFSMKSTFFNMNFMIGSNKPFDNKNIEYYTVD